MNIKHTDVSVNENVSVNRNGNGVRKLQENPSQKLSKREAIARLKLCNYRTAPKTIATYLHTIFSNKNTKPGHWLYIAQHYTPKTINSVLNEMLKGAERGDITPKVPSAYFTYVIKKRKTRKIFRKEEIELPDF